MVLSYSVGTTGCSGAVWLVTGGCIRELYGIVPSPNRIHGDELPSDQRLRQLYADVRTLAMNSRYRIVAAEFGEPNLVSRPARRAEKLRELRVF
jgi:hypothetical protein